MLAIIMYEGTIARWCIFGITRYPV